MPKDKKCPYEIINEKMNEIELRIKDTKRRIEKLTATLDQEAAEECADVQESDLALQEALNDYFVDELLKKKPVGEA